MSLVEIKRAEAALKDGRLEECRGLLTESLRKHRRGQTLTGRLARAFAARGQAHLEAGRMEQAGRDGQAAAELSAGLPETAALQAALCRALEEARLAGARDARRVSHARELFRNGHFSHGEHLLEDVDDTDRADSLRHHAQRKRVQIDDRRDRVTRALKADDVSAALDALRAADACDLDGPLADVATETRTRACKAAETALRDGRPDVSGGIVAKLRDIAPADQAVNDLSYACRQCHRAAVYLHEGRADRAAEALGRLGATGARAKWVDQACKQSEQAATLLASLRAGPLGLLLGSQVDGRSASGRMRKPGVTRGFTIDRSPRRDTAASLPDRFILQVDGAGSYLVLRSRCVTVGALASSPRPALRLHAHANIPILCLERSDDDYLLLADRPVDVAGKSTTRTLLADGQTITMQGGYNLCFGRPNAASGTALLTPTGVRLAEEEATHVLLVDRDILIGGGRANHVRPRGVDDRITLFLRDGGLHVRADQPVEVDGRPLHRTEPLPMHVSIRIGAVSFVLKELKDGDVVAASQAGGNG